MFHSSTKKTRSANAGRPIVQDSVSKVNPFGQTLYYGYDGAIFEIMENNHISSVNLFFTTPIHLDFAQKETS